MSNVKGQMLSVRCQMSTAYVDPWDMLNNFCFNVYAQKWHMLNVKCQVSNAYVDPWDMLNNFCFNVYAVCMYTVYMYTCKLIDYRRN